MINDYDSAEKSRSMFTEVYTQKRGTCITVVLLGIIIGIFAFAYITFGNETIADSLRSNHTLKLVSIIIEHGQTAPKFTYPRDPYLNDSRWQSSLGELTKRGKQSMHNLGKFFRERYSALLPDLYFSTDIRVLSSNADTCLMSAAVALAGLYPPHKFQVWNPHVLWQPIPVKGISEEVDRIIDITQSCPSLPKKKKQIENVLTNGDNTLPKLYDFLSENTGTEIRNLSSILALYNLILVQDKTNLPLSDWIPLVYPEKMLPYAIKALKLETGDAEITKLTTGVLLDKIISDMNKKSTRELSTKMFLYSAHEQSIFNIFSILNGGKGREASIKPEFSSSVMIELHTVEEQNIVQAYYLSKPGKTPHHINITECGDPCLLDNFIKFTKPFIPQDWIKACSS